MIHFGNACLAPTRRLPGLSFVYIDRKTQLTLNSFIVVMHVFTKKVLNVESLTKEIETKFGSEKVHLAIFYDVCFHHCMSDLKIDLENITVLLCKPDTDGLNVDVKCGRVCKDDLDSRYLSINSIINVVFIN